MGAETEQERSVVAFDLQRRFESEASNKSSNRVFRLSFGLYKTLRDSGDCFVTFRELDENKAYESEEAYKAKCATEPANLRVRIKPYSEPLAPV
jgi:hypothetical protein